MVESLPIYCDKISNKSHEAIASLSFDRLELRRCPDSDRHRSWLGDVSSKQAFLIRLNKLGYEAIPQIDVEVEAACYLFVLLWLLLGEEELVDFYGGSQIPGAHNLNGDISGNLFFKIPFINLVDLFLYKLSYVAKFDFIGVMLLYF